jgi:hypothetical protein
MTAKDRQGSHAERTRALAAALRASMDREAGLFVRLGGEIESLRESMQARSWGTGLAIAQAIERSAGVIEEADDARADAFVLLRDHLKLPQATAFSAVLPALPDGIREELEGSWRQMRVSLVRLKTATSRMRYSAEALAGALNAVLEQVFPHRRGRIYSRRGTPTAVVGTPVVDRKL